MSKRHVAIIGAGVVGISSALYARRLGWNVTLIDPQGLAQGASRGNAGMIATSECLPIGSWSTIKSVPSMLLSSDGPLHIRPSYLLQLLPWLCQMAWNSRTTRVQAISQALAQLLQHAVTAHRELANIAGCADLLQPTGWIKAINDPQRWQQFQSSISAVRSHGVKCEILNADGIAQRAPALRGKFQHAVHHPDCLQVGEPGHYVRSLGTYALQQGIELHTAHAEQFQQESARVTGVHTSTGSIACDAVIVAAGAHSRPLAKALGQDVPLDTERGYHMMLDTSACTTPLLTPLHWVEKSLVLSPMDGGLRVTSSVEFAGLDAPAQFELVRKHLPALQALLPGVQLRKGSEWLGFRPSMPDSLPVIGRAGKTSNAWLAFGHGHLGLTLGPITGKLIAHQLEGLSDEVDLHPYAATRFRKAASAT